MHRQRAANLASTLGEQRYNTAVLLQALTAIRDSNDQSYCQEACSHPACIASYQAWSTASTALEDYQKLTGK